MLYEPMKKEHAGEVEKLQREWFAEDITYGFVAGTAEQIAESVTPYCLIAKDGDRIVGFIMAELCKDNEKCIFPAGVSFVEINDFFVTKAYRSRGIGRALIRACEDAARENGIKHVLLSSATKDAEAVRRFYTGNGYTIWTTVFCKNLDE